MLIKKVLFSIFFVVTIVLLSGCSNNNPKWLLIEYPVAGDNTTMRFPGAQADEYLDCVEQYDWVKDMNKKSNKNSKSRFQCGSNCRFSREMGSPLCDELKNLQ